MWFEFAHADVRWRDARDRDLTLAWQMNRLWLMAWSGKLPPLRDVLDPAAPPSAGPQTGKQIAASLHALAGRYGLKVTKEPRPRAI